MLTVVHRVKVRQSLFQVIAHVVGIRQLPFNDPEKLRRATNLTNFLYSFRVFILDRESMEIRASASAILPKRMLCFHFFSSLQE